MGAELSLQEEDREDFKILHESSIDAVAHYIKDSATNIVVLTGAGISTSAGIPDFRSPETGLYANLERLSLPYAEAVFDISYFRINPDPFYVLARELYPGKYVPTISHAFIALLSQKGKLRMLFTQNIDCLERVAGIPADQIIEAHGSFATQRCIECKTEYPKDLMMEAIENSRVPYCSENTHPEKPNWKCNGLVKPDIVFFGEQLPEAFHRSRHIPSTADLMLIIGTSLTVHPFASLPQLAREGVPRVLFNMEKVGGLGSRENDVCVLGPCDDGIRKLAEALGWTTELEELWAGMGGGKDKSSTEASINVEDEVDQITKDIEKATLNSKSWLEKHLEKKVQMGPGNLQDETIPKAESKSPDPAQSGQSVSPSSSSEPAGDIETQDSEHEEELRKPDNSTSSDTTSKATLPKQSNPLLGIDVDNKEATQDSSVPKEDTGLPESLPKSPKSNI